MEVDAESLYTPQACTKAKLGRRILRLRFGDLKNQGFESSDTTNPCLLEPRCSTLHPKTKGQESASQNEESASQGKESAMKISVQRLRA